jgi:hypothetical protein
MNEKEKSILENFSKILPQLTEAQKEYFMGIADGAALAFERSKKSKRKPKPKQV